MARGKLGRPEHGPLSIAAGVTRRTFAAPDGVIRVTADDPDIPDPSAAWWVAADTAEARGRLLDVLRPWGVSGDRLRFCEHAERERSRIWGRLAGE